MSSHYLVDVEVNCYFLLGRVVDHDTFLQCLRFLAEMDVAFEIFNQLFLADCLIDLAIQLEVFQILNQLF